MHYCWFNGTITEAQQVKLHYNDLGLLRGYGLFDYFRTYNQKPFQWDWYWERFEKSAKLLKISKPVSKDQAYSIVMKLIEMQGKEECAIRFLLTGGYAFDSVNSLSPNLLIISEDLHASPEKDYLNGIKVMSYEYVRDLPTIKSIDYKHYMILQEDLKAQNASDVLFYKNGEISELSRSNVFAVKGDKLITPDNNILHGITRRTVLELAKNDFEIQERSLFFQELLDADEVFTTSTTKRVLPISMVDENVIGAGKIGPKTQYLLDKINNLVDNW
jgi:branched-subunit amino acid aminotransferase/4-amino-4-deoxychorismate lyase